MGTGRSLRRIASGLACGLLLGCAPDAPASGNSGENSANAAVEQTATLPAADAPLGEWLVGTWSFDATCATDFIIRYDADGKLDNAGEVGRWELKGDQLTETVTERFDNGGEAPVKVEPPTTRTYAIKRTDATHGVITFQKRDVPILRC